MSSRNSSRKVRGVGMAGRWFVAVCVALSALWLGGCATAPEIPTALPSAASLDAFALEGRFSLYQDTRGYSGRLSWTHTPAASEVLLSSPLGQGVAEIAVDAGGARLKTGDGKVYAAPDVDTLTRDVLGYALPLAQLADWVRGRADGGEVVRDVLGRITQLRHGDWRVSYGYRGDEAGAPPIRLDAQRLGEFELRLFIDEWRSLSAPEVRQ